MQARNATQDPTIVLLIEETIKNVDEIAISQGSLGQVATKCGFLWKRGNRLKQWTKRYYFLQGNFMYYFTYVPSLERSELKNDTGS